MFLIQRGRKNTALTRPAPTVASSQAEVGDPGLLLSDVDTWNVGALQSIAFELGDELKTIEGVAGDLS